VAHDELRAFDDEIGNSEKTEVLKFAEVTK
jgi:hypothetical protein